MTPNETPRLTETSPPPMTPNSEHPKKGVDPHHWAAAHVKIVDHNKAIVHTTKKKVAIVGFAMSTALEAPFEDPDFEIWGMNQLYRHIPRADRWFEIHHNWNEHVVEGTDHQGWLKEFQGPIYNAYKIPGIPNSIPFPLEDCVKFGLDYFTSSISYMIALAIRDGFTTVHLYGIDLIVGEEYDYQKPCAEFWLGFAHGKGIELGIHKKSALLKHSYRYGYETEPQSLVLITELQKRMVWLREQRNKRMVEIANLDGALQDVEMWNELATLRMRQAHIAYENPQ